MQDAKLIALNEEKAALNKSLQDTEALQDELDQANTTIIDYDIEAANLRNKNKELTETNEELTDTIDKTLDYLEKLEDENSDLKAKNKELERGLEEARTPTEMIEEPKESISREEAQSEWRGLLNEQSELKNRGKNLSQSSLERIEVLREIVFGTVKTSSTTFESRSSHSLHTNC